MRAATCCTRPSATRALRGAGMSMIFQEPMSSLNPVFSVGFQIAEVLREHLGLSRGAARRRALELLSEVRLADPVRALDSYPFQLRGRAAARDDRHGDRLRAEA